MIIYIRNLEITVVKVNPQATNFSGHRYTLQWNVYCWGGCTNKLMMVSIQVYHKLLLIPWPEESDWAPPPKLPSPPPHTVLMSWNKWLPPAPLPPPPALMLYTLCPKINIVYFLMCAYTCRTRCGCLWSWCQRVSTDYSRNFTVQCLRILSAKWLSQWVRQCTSSYTRGMRLHHFLFKQLLLPALMSTGYRCSNKINGDS